MNLSIETTREVQATLTRWNKEAAMHFCRLSQHDGVRFENITYPTGLRMVRASHWLLAEAAEVPLQQAKALRANGFKVISA